MKLGSLPESESVPKDPKKETPDEQNHENDGGTEHKQQKIKASELEGKDVESVAIYKDVQTSTTWCAVSRSNKSLEIYNLDKPDAETVEPSLVYKTPKRVGSMCFAALSRSDGTSHEDPCLIAGDVAGDAYAYCLTKQGRRLLLGHTASMITGIQVWKDRILTADRDEKIRVSHFPETYEIDGYFLGHDAYVTSLAMASEGQNAGTIVSCSGDNTVRLWNLKTLGQVAEMLVEDALVPTNVAIARDGSKIAVIFDESNRLDLYQVQGTDELALKLLKTVNCPSQPLTVAFGKGGTEVLAVVRDPDYIVGYKLEEDFNITPAKLDAVESIRQKATENKLEMPTTVLEKDERGQPKLQKLSETRGPAQANAPWNRVERIETEKQRNQRRKKRKREQKQEKDDS